MTCKKKKLDKIGAMLIIANSNKKTQKSFKRKEKKFYFVKNVNVITQQVKIKYENIKNLHSNKNICY